MLWFLPRYRVCSGKLLIEKHIGVEKNMSNEKLTHPVDVEPIPELSPEARQIIFGPRPSRIRESKVDHISIPQASCVLILIAACFVAFCAWNSIEVWVCDRFDWLPRSVALEKIKMAPGNETIIPVSVTGIRIINSTERIADFDWEIKPTKENPAPARGPYRSSITFRLYDDGWRAQ